MTWYRITWHDTTWKDTTWDYVISNSMTWNDMAWHGPISTNHVVYSDALEQFLNPCGKHCGLPTKRYRCIYFFCDTSLQLMFLCIFKYFLGCSLNNWKITPKEKILITPFAIPICRLNGSFRTVDLQMSGLIQEKLKWKSLIWNTEKDCLLYWNRSPAMLDQEKRYIDKPCIMKIENAEIKYTLF